MAMVLLKLTGNALGSVVMYWGLMLLLVAPWMLALVVILLINQGWNQVTGNRGEWRWYINGVERFIKGVSAIPFGWVGWIPGLLIQLWFAGYAAHLVQTSTQVGQTGEAIALHTLGIGSLLLAAAVFYGLYTRVVAVTLPHWVYLLLGGVALASYGVLLQHPALAATLSDRWQQVFLVLLTEFGSGFGSP